MSEKKEEKKEIIKLTEKTVVIASGKDRFHKEDEPYEVHPKQVPYLEENGLIKSTKKK